MCLTEHRPFLGKTGCDLTRTVGEINCEIEYVLNNAWFLVVRFFNEKRIILDSFGERLGGDESPQREEMHQYAR